MDIDLHAALGFYESKFERTLIVFFIVIVAVS